VDAAAVRRMTAQLQEMAGANPLLIATDQEGGRVQRLVGKPFTRLPSAALVGERAGAAETERLGRVIGRELRAVGLNWNFAPVCDLRFANTHREIRDRSLGSDPARVAGMVAAEVAGFQAGGVLPCLKHFPGQGATAVDSHVSLPTLRVSDARLMAREFVPFRKAMSAPPAALSVMAAHILTPGLDRSGLPASLNPAILTSVLRRRLGFDGVVITDDLEMDPIANRWGVGPAAVRAIIAGADMALIGADFSAQLAARNALLRAARSGALPAARIDEAVRRIQAAKAWAASRPPVPLSVLGSPEHQAVVRAIRRR
jgi:beta-N-acetylhexosaminidase